MSRCFVSLSAALIAIALPLAGAETPETRMANVFISSGDNHWLGESLPMDSEQSFRDGIQFLKDAMGMKILYWRGLQEAAWAKTHVVRDENFRYASMLRDHGPDLIVEKKLERRLCDIAAEMGVDVWGVATLGDWGASADTPGFNDFPFHGENRLRLDHPEWVPVDKYGRRRQGGAIEFAYPEARKALVDLHVGLVGEAGYKGVMFLTYVENFSLRFEDEFGYSQPIVEEFKKRYRIDIRYEPFTKYASKADWHRLRGEYVTAYLRELKTELAKLDVKLGVFLNPDRPHYPMTWATLPHVHPTIGAIYMDYQAWIRDGIVDRLAVYGSSSRQSQFHTTEDVLWQTRDTPVTVAAITSSAFDAGWAPFRARGVEMISTLGDDEQYLFRGRIPEQPKTALRDGTPIQQMRFLAQVHSGASAASAEDVLPFASQKNTVMRRLALAALAKIGDPKGVPAIEAALDDPEIGVRAAAIKALGTLSGPESWDKAIAALDAHGVHPDFEMARNYLHRMRPFPREKAIAAIMEHPNGKVRNVVLRAMNQHNQPGPDLAPVYRAKLEDPFLYTRYTAAEGLTIMRNNPEMVELLFSATHAPDAAVRNRAALSLAQLASQGDAAALARKGELIDRVAEMYRAFGEGKDAPDQEWGYRTLGESLLFLGQAGRAVLERFINDPSDPRLAELAWRALNWREKLNYGANAFNLISEYENDRLFAARPSFLKTQTFDIHRQGFDRKDIFPEGVTGNVGASAAPWGRWSAFGPKGPRIATDQFVSAPASVRLQRGGGQLAGWYDRTWSDADDFECRLMVRRDEGAGLSVGVKSSGGLRLQALVDERGRLRLWDFTAEAWKPVEATVPAGAWVQLTLITNQADSTYTARVEADGKTQSAGLSLPLGGEGNYYQIVVSAASGPEGAGVWVDDIAIVGKR